MQLYEWDQVKKEQMNPLFTRIFWASIIGRARFIEDLLAAQVERGLRQYVILGAGLDTFAQRKPEIASRLTVFEVDQPGPQAWKRERLEALGFGVPSWLRLVPFDFEADLSWQDALVTAGFDRTQPALVVSTGVSMYLTKEANMAALRQAATLAPGSTLAMTFFVPFESADAEVRPGLEMAAAGARASGTPFLSFYEPNELLQKAREAGFARAEHVSADDIAERYFAGRADGLRPPRNTEELLIATT